MRHNPAAGAIIIMLRSLQMHGMAQAVGELTGKTSAGGVKVTEARRQAARPPSRERRSMPRERATPPRQ